MTRRTVLARTVELTGALGCGLAWGAPAKAVEQTNAPEPSEHRFRHRGYLGWITDLATTPDATAPWPSMRLEEALLADYRQTFALMQALGFNEISIWGLYVSRAWPVDVTSAVTPARGARVERLIAAAHAHGLRVYSGLGLYSWGFEEIIRAHPNLSRGNTQAMCASEPAAWDWMRKVIDFVFARFPIDGVSMQSADQGRCPCPACQAYTNAAYHALLNVRAADYIRSRYPGKTVGVNSWGLGFEDEAALPTLVRMSRSIDYLIDVHDSSRRGNPAYRRTLIEALDCDFGTLGGPQVEPPQHWRRDRWFLPTLQGNGTHLQTLFTEGGRACEFFFHILANPADEISLWLAGKVLSDPQTPWRTHLQTCVEQLYGTPAATVRDALAEIFLRAERAYFRNGGGDFCGTLSLEPLVGDRPGPPVYLTQRLNPAQRAAYRDELAAIKSDVAKIAPDVPDKQRIARVLRCIEGTLADLA